MMANPLSGAETTELQSFLYPVNNTSLRTNSKFIELPVISLSWSQRNIPLSSIDQAIPWIILHQIHAGHLFFSLFLDWFRKPSRNLPSYCWYNSTHYNKAYIDW